MNAHLLEKVLSCPRLPTLPAVAMQVIELTNRDDVSAQEIARTIQNDQGLSAKILKTVNSAFYGRPRRCSTISHAIVALGLNAVKTLALGFSLVEAIKEGEGEAFDYADYWRRGVFTGVGARCVAQAAGAGDPEEVFLGGILQDVGMIALHQALGKKYVAVVQASGGDHRQLVKHEIETLELQHPEIGAMLAERWRLPESLIAPIKYHERPTAAPLTFAPTVRCVGLGNIAADALSWPSDVRHVERFVELAERWFSIAPESAQELLAKIGEGATEMAKLLQLDVGGPANVENLSTMASERLEKLKSAPARAPAESSSGVLDPVTRVGLRGPFEERMRREFEERADGSLSVLVMSAPGLERLRSGAGDAALNAALAELGDRLNEFFRGSGGSLCRLDQRRFAAVLPGVGRMVASRMAEEFRETIGAAPLKLAGVDVGSDLRALKMSVGVASAEGGESAFVRAEQLLMAAEQAAEAASVAGGDCVRVFKPRSKAA